MRGIFAGIITIMSISLLSAAIVAANQPTLSVVQHFADIPPSRLGEGIAIHPTGTVFVSTISFAPGDGKIFVFDTSGMAVGMMDVPGRPIVTGLTLARGGALYAAATTGLDPSAQGAVVSIDVQSGAVTTIAEGFIFPNGLAFDNKGNLFVTDSFLGKVFKISPTGAVSVFASGPLLEGLPPDAPFGANGLAFNKERTALYVANTARGTIVEIEVRRDGSAGELTVFASGIASADGVAFDVKQSLYVTANFVNEVWVVAPDGSAEKLEFDITQESLENPASLAFRGRDLYITNLGLGTFSSKVSVVTVEHPGQSLAP